MRLAKIFGAALLLLSKQALSAQALFLYSPALEGSIKLQNGPIYSDNGTAHYPASNIPFDYVGGDIDRPNTWKRFDVTAAADGLAVQSYEKGYGNFVLIRHNVKDAQGRLFLTLYAHLTPETIPNTIPTRDRFSPKFDRCVPRDCPLKVKAGDFIGKAGTTGLVICSPKSSVSCNMVHFEVFRGAYYANPIDPYDISSTRQKYKRDAYPPFQPCGRNRLWVTCPPAPPSQNWGGGYEIQRLPAGQGAPVALSSDGRMALVLVNGMTGVDVLARGPLGSGWAVSAQLPLSSRFAGNVALSADGRTAIVNTNDPYAAEVFRTSGSTWSPAGSLMPDDIAPGTIGLTGDVALSSDGNTALVGIPGANAAYIFRLNGAVWSQRAKLPGEVAGGYSVALSRDGHIAALGDIGYGAPNALGAILIYHQDTNGFWHFDKRLTPSHPTISDHFGLDVAMSADGTVILTGTRDNGDVGHNHGASYIYTGEGSSWTEKKIPAPAEVSSDAYFGHSVALSDDGKTALISARYDNSPQIEAGSAYIYKNVGGVWNRTAKVTAPQSSPHDFFGIYVALSANGGEGLIAGSISGVDVIVPTHSSSDLSR